MNVCCDDDDAALSRTWRAPLPPAPISYAHRHATRRFAPAAHPPISHDDDRLGPFSLRHDEVTDFRRPLRRSPLLFFSPFPSFGETSSMYTSTTRHPPSFTTTVRRTYGQLSIEMRARSDRLSIVDMTRDGDGVFRLGYRRCSPSCAKIGAIRPAIRQRKTLTWKKILNVLPSGGNLIN